MDDETDSTLRTCKHCHVSKSLSAFVTMQGGTGRKHKCKLCRNTERKEQFAAGVGEYADWEKTKKARRDAYVKKPDRKQTRQERYEKHREWATANREKMNKYARDCRLRNIERYRENQNARQRLRNFGKRNGERISALALDAMLDAQRGRCWYCQKKLHKYHIEHRIPISRGGPHHLSNIVISCPPCNFSKGAKMPWEMTNPRLF